MAPTFCHKRGRECSNRGRKTALAVVLFHGLTNNPAQYAQFAPLLHEGGVNVLVPRFPEYGYRDRMTTRTAAVTPERLLAVASEAVAIAGGLGQRIAVLGISMGALVAAYVAQFRAVDAAVLVAPSFALLHLQHFVCRILERVALALPSAFIWWDPRARESERAVTAYPRFSTHALARSLSIGDTVYAAAQRRAPLARRIVTLVNRADPAVNNAVAARVCAAWSTQKPGAVEYVELTGLPRMDDIVDPQQPRARTDLVYPKLLAALDVVPELRP